MSLLSLSTSSKSACALTAPAVDDPASIGRQHKNETNRRGGDGALASDRSCRTRYVNDATLDAERR